jgi:ribosome recycling factor
MENISIHKLREEFEKNSVEIPKLVEELNAKILDAVTKKQFFDLYQYRATLQKMSKRPNMKEYCDNYMDKIDNWLQDYEKSVMMFLILAR